MYICESFTRIPFALANSIRGRKFFLLASMMIKTWLTSKSKRDAVKASAITQKKKNMIHFQKGRMLKSTLAAYSFVNDSN